ncbi:hypothetical protein PRIPAC_81275, partial [Pristionchus pacificus]|uniref:DUF148 domain-containing protein n=1 Tax=Pristionchus pacificus TaxID=54126 RepID=A0A2A6BHH4_PRIPA
MKLHLLLLLPALSASFYPENVAFLSSINSPQATTDYNQIVTNQQLTRTQMEQQLGQWATKYGATSQIQQLITARATMLKSMADTATSDAQNLPSLIQKMYGVASSGSLTGSQMESQMRQMLDSATAGQKKMAMAAFGIELNPGSNNGNNNGGFGNNNNGGF